MIIDFHAHIVNFDWLPQRWWDWLEEFYNSGRNKSLLPPRKGSEIIDEICDFDGSRLMTAMADAQIDQSIVLPLDWGILLGEPSVSIEEQNLRIAEIADKSDGKIVSFVGVDPRRKNAFDFIRYCLKDCRMKGIKLYSAAGYDLYDTSYRPIFEAAIEYNVPVLLHTGYSFGPFISKYCEPAVLDFLCATYPSVKFIAAHLGAGYTEQLSWLGYAKPNLYADCSLMQIRARQNFSDFAKNLRFAADLFGSRRILFGTDWPFSKNIMNSKDYIESFNKLTSKDCANYKFANYEVRQILGGSAKQLLT